MWKLFDGNFFKFAIGFVLIVGISMAMIAFVSYHYSGNGGSANARDAVDFSQGLK
jgi:hypothetical protein